MTGRFIVAIISSLIGLILVSPLAAAPDPPGRVGRLSLIEGVAQQRTAEDADWTPATLNYPVTSGSAVATQDGSRVEIQVGAMAVRVGGASELDVNELADHTTVLTLARGEINLRIDHLPEGDRVEIVTPRGTADIVAAGRYHLDSGSTETATRIAVFNGRAEVPRGSGFVILGDGQAALIYNDEPSGITLAEGSADALDEWAFSRDRGLSRAAARDYVSPEVTGGSDLANYGTWRYDPRYGEIWYPSDLAADWTPYRYGHWAWVPPWGWTWVDDAPWGFAPFHYGRWVDTIDGWAWVPGIAVAEPVFAPALVGFVGSPPFIDARFSTVAWFPLAPFEVFVPAFPASIVFIRKINITNVNITNLNVTKVDNVTIVNGQSTLPVSGFANHRFVTTVSSATFTSGDPVHRAILSGSASGIAPNTPVSPSPINVSAPRRAARGNGWRPAGAVPIAAATPPLPSTGIAGSSSTGTAAETKATGTTAAASPSRSRRSLSPLPSGDGATPNGSAATRGGGGERSAAIALTPSGHRVPPVPSVTPRSEGPTTRQLGSSALSDGNRLSPPSAQTIVAPPRTITSFRSAPPAPPMARVGVGTRGVPMTSVPAGPRPMERGGTAMHGLPMMPKAPAAPPPMAWGGTSMRSLPMPSAPAAQSRSPGGPPMNNRAGGSRRWANDW